MFFCRIMQNLTEKERKRKEKKRKIAAFSKWGEGSDFQTKEHIFPYQKKNMAEKKKSQSTIINQYYRERKTE